MKEGISVEKVIQYGFMPVYDFEHITNKYICSVGSKYF